MNEVATTTEMNMEVVLVAVTVAEIKTTNVIGTTETTAEIGVEIEIGAVHHMTETEHEMWIEPHTKVDKTTAAAVLSINTTAIHLVLGQIGQKTINIVDVKKELVRPVAAPHRIVTAQTIHATINVLIIKSQKRSTRKSHPKNMTVRMTIVMSRRKPRKANVKGPDQKVTDKHSN